jgi:hypothetical protein
VTYVPIDDIINEEPLNDTDLIAIGNSCTDIHSVDIITIEKLKQWRKEESQ